MGANLTILLDIAERLSGLSAAGSLINATKYVAGGYLWNSGMFLIRDDRYIEELKNFRTDICGAYVNFIASTQHD